MYDGTAQAAAYAEWWYFNLEDPEHGVRLAVTYMVLDPANLSRFGGAFVTAIVYTPDGQFTETSVHPPSAFLASSEQADVLIAGVPWSPNYVRVLTDDTYRIAGAIDQEHRVSWDLRYVRRAAPWLGADRQHVGVLPWENMSWLQYMPGAAVTGAVEIDGRQYRVANVRGYHDHNWGTWIPFTVAWNWAQYFEPGLNFSIGDFRRSPAGAVSIDVLGERTVFAKDEYVLVHEAWTYDAGHGLWFPGQTWLSAQNDRQALIVRMRAHATVPVLPPDYLPLPFVPVIYEQTADFRGWLWEKDQAGTWVLIRSFGGDGFKEYTGIALPPR